ncbi:3-oxo-5-alpha-steroid 4-dehydrogenase [Mycobacterium sp. SM3041]|jgi:3-oxo-5-alpha-steroid 4-dehydrogenase 1|uniref:3-oxo-5-alpha-steroid 4-dehydrogenase n=1 Tax=Mycobacterium sp. SM3041 TaxID=3114291 RepID=UPI003204E9EB
MVSAYHAALAFLAVLTVITLVSGIWYVNPYGRFAGDGQRFALPAKAGWLLFECPQWWAFALTFWLVVPEHGAPAIVLFVLWQAHYLYRGLIYPLTRKSAGKQFPASGVAFGFTFNAVNGFANGYAVAVAAHLQQSAWFTDPRFLAGVVVAVGGWVVNFHADRVLINLRSDGFTGYRIPHGGAYRWVSSGNYLGELVLWTGWAIMVWTLPGLIFLLFSIANLGPRAIATHKWYRRTFSDYPRNRKALIPGLL